MADDKTLNSRGQKRRRVGQRPKCTPAVQARVCQSLSNGNYREPACVAAGITVKSFYNWRRRGEDELERIAEGEEPNPIEKRYVQFLHATTRAESEAESFAVDKLRSLVEDGDLKAIQFYLERKHNQKWGKSKRVEHTGADGGPVAIAAATVQVGENMTAQEAVDTYRALVASTKGESE